MISKFTTVSIGLYGTAFDDCAEEAKRKVGTRPELEHRNVSDLHTRSPYRARITPNAPPASCGRLVEGRFVELHVLRPPDKKALSSRCVSGGL